jgi:hypothetical protein
LKVFSVFFKKFVKNIFMFAPLKQTNLQQPIIFCNATPPPPANNLYIDGFHLFKYTFHNIPEFFVAISSVSTPVKLSALETNRKRSSEEIHQVFSIAQPERVPLYNRFINQKPLSL